MKKKLFFIILLVLCLSSLSAWDGERKGFQLGIGVGGGFDSYWGIQYDAIGSEKQDNSSIALAIAPRIGYAFTNQLALYYSRHPFIYSVEDKNGKDMSVATCIEAVHIDYYLTDSAPSLFFGLGAGVGYFMDENVSNYSNESLKGIGVFATLGFEPIKHVTAELSVHYKSQQEGASNLGVSAVVNLIGY